MEYFEDLSETFGLGLLNRKRNVMLKEWINWIQYKEKELTNDEKSSVRIQSLRKYYLVSLIPILRIGFAAHIFLP